MDPQSDRMYHQMKKDLTFLVESISHLESYNIQLNTNALMELRKLTQQLLKKLENRPTET